MSAGLPGLGLGGFFFVLSALAAPLIELPRLLAGRSSAAAWREIGRNVVISLLICVMVDLALRMVLFGAWLLGESSGGRLTDFWVLPAGPMAVTLLLLAALLAGAKLAQLCLGSRAWIRARAQRRRPLHGPSCPCCSE
jgi:hypothetical protein